MPDQDYNRVLFLTHSPQDALVTTKVLSEAGVDCRVCRSLAELVVEAQAGVGAVMMPEEALDDDQLKHLSSLLGSQPEWSDIPLLLLIRPRSEGRPDPRILDLRGLVYMIERPVWIASLLSAVQSALRTRRRQYEQSGLLHTLEGSQAKLIEADRRKDEFLAMLAHELRNPMAAITGVAQMLSFGASEPDEITEMADILARQTTHMNRLLDDLLDVSRVTRGKVELHKTILDIADVVSQAVETVRAKCELGGIRLAVHLSERGDVKVFGDLTRLVQIVANVLNNACKFTDANGSVAISVDATPDEVNIIVKDDGIGMDPADVRTIFDLFGQVESAKKRSGGLGIGLALVKGLAELHGGSVSASSPGRGLGSSFTITLPRLIEDGVDMQTATLERRPDSRAGFKLLLVEDNVDVAKATTRLLRMFKHDVTHADSGQAALDACAASMPDVVLLDIGLPDMVGYDVAQSIRSMAGGNRPIIVAMSGWAQSEDRQRSSRVGCDDHLCKPVDAKLMNDTVHRLMGDRRAE